MRTASIVKRFAWIAACIVIGLFALLCIVQIILFAGLWYWDAVT